MTNSENVNVSRETISPYEHILSAFKEDNAEGKTTHAYMFEGGDNNSRVELSKKVARLLLCESKGENGDYCSDSENEMCSTCRKILHGQHPDVVLYGDSFTENGNISVATARDIRKDAFMLPNEADCRIFIICNAEKLNSSAQNALLKILEEPPKDVIFILLCSFKNVFLPTTLSRVRIYRLHDTAEQSIINDVMTSYAISDSELAKAAAGYILSASKQTLEKNEIEQIKNSIEICKKLFLSVGECRLIEYLPKKRDELIVTLDMLSLAARDILACKYGITETMVLYDIADVKKAAGRMATAKLVRLYDELSKAANALEKYTNVNSVLSVLSTIAE